ncbi:MAG: PaaI family thioesterase [Methylococcaceae bacterium]|nr:PaaI family thioesterase [Methylococcaceae bacterium]
MDTQSFSKDDFFQKYMPGDVCFGCGHSNTAGLQIKSYWQGDDCVCIWQPEIKHQGWPGITCGGIIATLIDCHCMASAMATAIRNENRPLGSKPEYRFATGTLHIKYLKPTPIASPLTLKAKVTQIKNKRIYTLHCDVSAEKQKTVEAEVIAFLVYSSDQEHPEGTEFSA